MGGEKKWFVFGNKIYQWVVKGNRKVKDETFIKFQNPLSKNYQDYVDISELFVWETVEEIKKKVIDWIRFMPLWQKYKQSDIIDITLHNKKIPNDWTNQQQ